MNFCRATAYLLVTAGAFCPGSAGRSEGGPFEEATFLRTLPAFFMYLTKNCGLSPLPPGPPCAEELIVYD